MTLAYAVRMIVEAEGGGPASLRMIADHVGRWARIPDPMIETTQKGLKDSLVTTEVLGDPDDPPWAWRLSFSHPDETYPNVRWGVRVTAVTAATSVVSVRLDRTRTDGVVARDRTEPAPPGCIPALIGAAGLSVVDGGRCLESSVWVVESDQEQDLADLVMAEDRRLPIFVFTPRDEEVIDGGEFQRSVMGLAHVVLLKPEVSWRLGEILPRGFNVYGGSARIWWPEVTTDSSRWDHPLWTSDRPAHLVVRQARSSILEAGLTAAVIDRRVIELEQAKRVETDQKIDPHRKAEERNEDQVVLFCRDQRGSQKQDQSCEKAKIDRSDKPGRQKRRSPQRDAAQHPDAEQDGERAAAQGRCVGP